MEHRVVSCLSSFVRVQKCANLPFLENSEILSPKQTISGSKNSFSHYLLFEDELTLSTQKFAPFHYHFIVYSAKVLVPAKLSPEPSSTLSKKENTMTRLAIPCSVFQANRTASPIGLKLTRISVLQLQIMTFLRRSIRAAFVGVKT